MTSTYVAGYNGTAESHAAVALAVRLAEPGSADVVALHVYSYGTANYWVTVESYMLDKLEADVRAEAEEVLEGLDVPGVTRQLLKADSPSHGLHEFAELHAAELIAVGVTHHHLLGRLAPGSVGMHLLHGAPCPVLVAPAGSGDRPLRTIGVAYDGREQSREALRQAEQLAGALDAHLVLLGATQPLVIPVGIAPVVPPEAAWEGERAFEAMLEEAAAETRPGTEHRMLTGPAAHAIAEASTEVDLLVTGSRGYGPVGGVLLGSVSRYLVDHAACPVVVVPRRA